MPLNDNHKNFINTSIDHLLDLNLNTETVRGFVVNLNQLIAGKVDEKNEHYFLSQCLLFPEKFLSGLELHGEVTVGKVQAYIANKITQVLKKAATTDDLIAYGWYGKLIIKKLLKNTKPFKTIQQVHDNLISPMWSLPEYSDTVYAQAVKVDYAEDYSLEAFLQVTVNVNPPVFEEVELTIPYFQYDDEEEEVVARVLAVAERRARGLASRAAIDYLQKQGQSYTDEDKYLVQHNRAAKKIITNQYWFEQLLACDGDSFMFSRIARLTSLQANNLTSRSIIDLIKGRIVDVDDVLNISEGVLSLVEHPFYFNKFRDNEWLIEWFEETPEDVSKVLIHPRVVYWLQKDLIGLDAAMALPIHLLRMNNNPSILACDLYGDYFSRQAIIDWDNLISLREDHCLFLMNADVAGLVFRGDISFEFIAMQGEEVMMLLNAGFLSLSACYEQDVKQLNVARLKYLFSPNVATDEKSEIMQNVLNDIEVDALHELLPDVINHLTEQMFAAISSLPTEKRAPLMTLYHLHSTWMDGSDINKLACLKESAEKILNEKKYLGPSIFIKIKSSGKDSVTAPFCNRVIDFVQSIKQFVPALFDQQQVVQRMI